MAADRSHPARGEPREISELKRLKTAHPELASAVDMQVALAELQRRVQNRVPLPWIDIDADRLRRHQDEGRPLLRFSDLPLDWTEFRLMFRETADILRRFDTLAADEYAHIVALAREGNTLEPVVMEWYDSAARALAASPEHPTDGAQGSTPGSPLPPMLNQVLVLAMRPFLVRCAEVILQRFDLSGWTHPRCPLCGGEPEFALITPTADRLLICSRCTGRWRYHAFACPFCQNADRTQITSFASRNGQYRVYGCDVCRRYLKAYDGRQSAKPLILSAETVATLPLDAAAIQKGYRG